ncbi:MAG: hypothetical protein V1892_01730 [bacterium]
METKDFLLKERSKIRQGEVEEKEKLKDLYMVVGVLFVIIMVVVMIIMKGGKLI